MKSGLAKFALAAILALVAESAAQAVPFAAWSLIQPAVAKVGPNVGTVVARNGDATHIKIVNFGTTVYTGPVNVRGTLDRIRANSKLPEQNDGGVWTNSQRLLPAAPAGYYREFVVWPASSTSAHPYGLNFPGPMRVVLGKNGEAYFTGDHYGTFQNVK